MGSRCFAVACAPDGSISRVLCNEAAVAASAGAGARFADIVESASRDKADNFLAVLRAERAATGWEMNVVIASRTTPLSFAGAATPDGFVIIASASRDSIRDHGIYDELSRLNNDLINRERELARKTAALERLSAEKNRVIAIAAHDLRNPLTVVASYAELLKIELEPAGDPAFYLEEIVRSAKFMGELVEELLDSARFEAGIVDLDLQELDLVAVAGHAATINRIRADRKQIVIAFEHDVDTLPIRADSVKLRQIVNNLIINAIKFSPVRTTVTIRVRGDGPRPKIEVLDEGIGIANDKLESIFEPFATLTSTGTAGEKSIGLGLAIVKKLVDLHHGTVSVRSEEGRGSCFGVEFPRVESAS